MRNWMLLIVTMLVAGAATAQIAIDDPVILQEADATNVPPIPAAQVQGTTEVGTPPPGSTTSWSMAG